MSEKERAMNDIRERLAEVLWEKFGAGPTAPLAAWLGHQDCVRFADAILAEFDVTPPTVKPSVEDVARAILGYRPEDLEFPTDLDHSRWGGALDQARAVLALFEKGGGRG